MNRPMQRIQVNFPVLAILVAAWMAATPAQAGTITIMYPTKEKPAFAVTAPDNWKLTPADEEGDFFDLEGPTGATLSFRAISGTDKDMESAIADSIDYLKKTYNNV